LKYIIICSTFIILLFHILRLKWFVKMVAKNELLKIIKYIDYLYLNKYIKNSLKYGFENNKNNEWKIFSTHYVVGKQKKDEQFNILNLVQSIFNQNEFNSEIFLITIHVYRKICIEYAHLIDNYVYLFGSIYITLNKILCDEFISNKFLSDIFDIEPNIINKMIKSIEDFIICDDIYFGIDEKNNIANEINCL